MDSQFAELITGFGKTVAIDDLKPDENGYVCLTFDGRAVNIEERDGVVYFYTVVGPLPADGKADLYARLLAANCFYRGTRGAVLGVDEKLGGVLLFYQTPVAALDRTRFETTLENFVNTAEGWSKQLQAATGEGTGAAAHAGTGAVWA